MRAASRPWPPAGPLVVVHGGGREVSADLARRGIPVRAVDGLRITDGPTLDVVVGVLAGQVNTRLVAALAAAGASAVGLTAADGRMASVRRASRYRAAERGRAWTSASSGSRWVSPVQSLCSISVRPAIFPSSPASGRARRDNC